MAPTLILLGNAGGDKLKSFHFNILGNLLIHFLAEKTDTILMSVL